MKWLNLEAHWPNYMPKPDINFVEKMLLTSRYFTRFLYTASILYVMTRTKPDLGSNRFGVVENLWLILCLNLVSTM
jgi:hypothetical protein